MSTLGLGTVFSCLLLRGVVVDTAGEGVLVGVAEEECAAWWCTIRSPLLLSLVDKAAP